MVVLEFEVLLKLYDLKTNGFFKQLVNLRGMIGIAVQVMKGLPVYPTLHVHDGK